MSEGSQLKSIHSFQSRDCPLFLISLFIEIAFEFFNQTEKKYGHTSVISLFSSLQQFKDMRRMETFLTYCNYNYPCFNFY